MSSFGESGPLFEIDVRGKLGNVNLSVGRGRGRGRGTISSTKTYNEDVFKSLDEVVEERGILKPPHWKSRSSKFADDEDSIVDLKGEVKVILNKKLDPKASSLDELIVSATSSSSGRKDGQGQGERGFKRKSFVDRDAPSQAEDEDGGDQGSDGDADDEVAKICGGRGGGDNGGQLKRRRIGMITPYRAVEFLSGRGMIIEMTVGKLEMENKDVSHLWRVEVASGDICGRAEAKRKVVAKEIASREFLKKLKIEYPNGQIPPYEIPNELYLDPKVFKMLDQLAAEKELTISHEITSECNGRMAKCTWTVDGDEFTATNPRMEYAKLEAAGKAYEHITGESFPKTRYFIGDQIKEDYVYEYSESETYIKDENEGVIQVDMKGGEPEPRKEIILPMLEDL